MQVVSYLVEEFVLPNLKAWVGLLVGAGASWLAQKGVDTGDVNALTVALTGLATGVLVWLFPNRDV